MSDLHLEFDSEFRPENKHNADVLILAGDISIFKYMRPESGLYKTFMPFFKHVSERWEKILYIPGNHEYYGHTDISSDIIQKVGSELPDNIHLANNAVNFHNDIVFVMGTMWTDINRNNPLDVMQFDHYMNDAKQIKDSGRSGYRFDGRSVLREHMVSKLFFKDTIEMHKDKKVVCITHHAPSPLSVHPRYAGQATNCYYNSDLSSLMEDNVVLWVHGHTHDNFDYTIGNTRVISNPKGYEDENKMFNPEFVLTL